MKVILAAAALMGLAAAQSLSDLPACGVSERSENKSSQSEPSLTMIFLANLRQQHARARLFSELPRG
jgi:hypothetical protein